MTWVKICGMTNLEDALVAVEAGADAVGFVFYEKSPRYVTPERAREIVERLPQSVERVGVFVLHGGAGPGLKFADVGLTAIQFYPFAAPHAPQDSPETGAWGAAGFPGLRKWFMALPAAYFIDGKGSADQFVLNFQRLRKGVSQPPAVATGLMDTYLLDSGGWQQPGGTGEKFDWNKAAPAVTTLQQGGLNIVVAGGLRPENVGGAIETLNPWGVDVASGVEARPGKKDPDKVRAFVRAVRKVDRRAS